MKVSLKMGNKMDKGTIILPQVIAMTESGRAVK